MIACANVSVAKDFLKLFSLNLAGKAFFNLSSLLIAFIISCSRTPFSTSFSVYFFIIWSSVTTIGLP